MSGSRPPPGVQKSSQAASTSPRTALARNISAGSSDVAVVPDVANPASRRSFQAQRDRQPVREAHAQPGRGAGAQAGNNSSQPGERPAQASGSGRSKSGELTASQRAKDPYRHNLLIARLKWKSHIAQGKLLLSRADSILRKEPKTASDVEMANELRKRGDYLRKEGTDSALRLEQEFLNSYSPKMKDFYTPTEVSYCTAISDVLKGEADSAKRLEKFRARLRTLASGSTLESDANLRCEYVQVIDQELRLMAGNTQKPASGNAARRSNQGSASEDSAAGVSGPTEGAGRSAGVREGGSPSKKRDAPDTFERPAADAIRRNTSQGVPPGRPNNDPSRMHTTLGIPNKVDPARVVAQSRGAGASDATVGPAGPAGPNLFSSHPSATHPSASPHPRQASANHPIASHPIEPGPVGPHPTGIHGIGSVPPGNSSGAGGGARPSSAGGSASPERRSRSGATSAGPSGLGTTSSSSGACEPARGSSSSGGSHVAAGRAPSGISVSDSSAVTAEAGSPRAMDPSGGNGSGSGRNRRYHNPRQSG